MTAEASLTVTDCVSDALRTERRPESDLDVLVRLYADASIRVAERLGANLERRMILRGEEVVIYRHRYGG